MAQRILLWAIPGLMLCVVPATEAADFRFYWQLVCIWLAAACLARWLTSWWWRLFMLAAIVQVVRYGPVLPAYMTLVYIGIFLAAANAMAKIPSSDTMDSICLSGIVLALWIGLQRMGLVQCYEPGDACTGPFNPDAAGVFLSMCLPAFLRGRVRPHIRLRWDCLIWLPGIAMILCNSTTAIIAAVAGLIVFMAMSKKGSSLATAGGALALIALATAVICITDPPRSTIENPRWRVWKHTICTYRSEPSGRGLNSYASIFPYFISGDKKLQGMHRGKDLPGGRWVLDARLFWLHAHNEYLQAGFEMGLHTVALIIAYLGAFLWGALSLRYPKPFGHGRSLQYLPNWTAGMAGLAVASAGWHVFHIAPLALLGCAWLGIAHKEVL